MPQAELDSVQIDMEGTLLVRNLVFAGGAAGLAVHQAVGAETHVDLRLAENAKLFAPALGFRLLALNAKDPA
jgi:hypothetical protein